MKPLSFPQLCRIARAQLERDVAATDDDWVEDIKITIARGGWAYPRPDEITRAMHAVERVVKRPLPAELRPKVTERPPHLPPLSQADAKRLYEEITKRIQSYRTERA